MNASGARTRMNLQLGLSSFSFPILAVKNSLREVLQIDKKLKIMQMS